MPNDQPDYTSVVARPQTQLAGSPWAYPSGTTTLTFTLAPDTSVICILLPAFPTITSLQVHGHTSTFTYVKAQPILTSFHPYYVAVINSAVDPQIDVTIATGTAGTAYVSSIPDPVASIVLPNQPAPWESPNQPVAKMDFGNPGSAAFQTIVPAPSNAQSIYLHSMQWEWNISTLTDAFGFFRTDDATEILADNPSMAGPRYIDFKGAKLAGGKAFQWWQAGAHAANGIFMTGALTYSIY